MTASVGSPQPRPRRRRPTYYTCGRPVAVCLYATASPNRRMQPRSGSSSRSHQKFRIVNIITIATRPQLAPQRLRLRVTADTAQSAVSDTSGRIYDYNIYIDNDISSLYHRTSRRKSHIIYMTLKQWLQLQPQPLQQHMILDNNIARDGAGEAQTGLGRGCDGARGAGWMSEGLYMACAPRGLGRLVISRVGLGIIRRAIPSRLGPRSPRATPRLDASIVHGLGARSLIRFHLEIPRCGRDGRRRPRR